MNDTPNLGGLPGSEGTGIESPDIDPRFDDAAAGTAPPRADASSATMRSAQDPFAEITTAASDWVRGKPMQALAIAAGVGFLLGRSGR